MGYTVGAICETNRTLTAYVLILAAACCMKVVAYYGAAGIIYGSWLVPMASIPGNLVQSGVAAVIVLPVVVKSRKYAAVWFWAGSRK